MVESIVSSKMSIPEPIPFDASGRYTGAVSVSVHVDQVTHSLFTRVQGERVQLETFTAPYAKEFKERFGLLVQEREEFSGLKKIFSNQTNVADYGSRKTKSEDEIRRLMELDSGRALKGEYFTGFAVVKRDTGEVVGRASIGQGREPGMSESGLILREDLWGKKYGLEVGVLLGALANLYFSKGAEVPFSGSKAPVTTFSAAALDTNQKSKKLLNYLGLERRDPPKGEESALEGRSFYALSGARVKEQLDRLTHPNKVSYHFGDESSELLSDVKL